MAHDIAHDRRAAHDTPFLHGLAHRLETRALSLILIGVASAIALVAAAFALYAAVKSVSSPAVASAVTAGVFAAIAAAAAWAAGQPGRKAQAAHAQQTSSGGAARFVEFALPLVLTVAQVAMARRALRRPRH